MLRVRLEVIPEGNIKKAKNLGALYIEHKKNEGTENSANYHVELRPIMGANATLKSKVENFPRLDRSAWHLVLGSLRAILGKDDRSF